LISKLDLDSVNVKQHERYLGVEGHTVHNLVSRHTHSHTGLTALPGPIEVVGKEGIHYSTAFQHFFLTKTPSTQHRSYAKCL